MSSSTPLNQHIQAILLQRNGESVSLLELQRELRRRGMALDLQRLRALMDPANYTALADDRYVLRDQLDAPAVAPAPKPVLFLPTLPQAQYDYVVFDLETTGTNPELDSIIQIAALRVVHGIPEAFCAWDVQCHSARLSPGLRRAIGLDDARVAAIAAAPALPDVLPEVQAFIGALPLVIHNARFDTAMLRSQAGLDISSVDTLELAYLLVPDAPRHNLGDLATFLGVEATTLPATHNLGGDFVPERCHLHNAVTDVLVLHAVYVALLQQYADLTPGERNLISRLLPEAFGQPVDPGSLAAILPSSPPISQRLAANTACGATVVLERYAVHAGLAPRRSQAEMLNRVESAFDNDTSLLIEAPTGTGKTLAYLIPAAVAAVRDGRRIALATAYKNLQDQLRIEVAHLQACLPFRAALLKGAGSYLCLHNLNDALENADDDGLDRRYLLTFLVRWARLGATLDELPYWLRREFPETTAVEREVAVDLATCTERRCPFFDRCHYFGAYQNGAAADILLINQALWLTESSRMPSFDALVIDEAHNLEDMATATFEEEVSEVSLRHQLRRLAVPGSRRGALHRLPGLGGAQRDQVRRARQMVGQSLVLLAELRHTLATFVTGCDERLHPQQGAQLRLNGPPARIYPTRWPVVQQALDQLWQVYLLPLTTLLSELLREVEADEIVLRTLQAVHDNLQEQYQLLDTVLRARRSDLVTWIAVSTDDNAGSWGFHATPISVAPLLAEHYRPLRSVILTSATLTTGSGDFRFFVERLGLHELLTNGQAYALAPELPYATNVMLGLPAYLSYTPAQATLQSFVEELAAELTWLYQYTDGRALTLFTSRNRLEAVWQRNAEALEVSGIPVLAQRGGASRQQLVEQFRTHGAAVLYGLRSFWEGVDVPGDALSFVIMEKLPYPALSDPVHSARREHVARRSGREFQDYLFPLMAIQFKQGFGRLLRKDSDRGAVIMYDRRVIRKSYLPELFGALPGFQPRDPVAERSRKGFYELLAQRLPGVIDSAAKSDFLSGLPDILTTDLEALVERLAIPDPLPDNQYDVWRPQILEALAALYGFADFRSVEQEAAFRAMLTGQDVFAVLPTGAGKSLCFQLPALLRCGVTIVCSPLIALMRDQIDKLADRGVEIAAALMSGQSAAEREEIMERVRLGRVRLLYLAPERLRDPIVQHMISTAPLRQIVVDEAHCVALWGPSFRPDFLVLPQIYTLRTERPPVAAFTATATPAIRTEICAGLALTDPVEVRAPVYRPELRLLIFDKAAPYHKIRSKTDQIQRLMLLVQTADQRGEAMLIYTATTTEAEYLARLLQVAGYPARAYHGRMPVQERTNVGELFMEGLISIVVCTKAFGMGIDKPDIRYVVHFHVPGDLESYFQEVGRAGRDGKTAYGILLYHPADERIQRFFIDQSRPDHQIITELWQIICLEAPECVLEPTALCEALDVDEHALRRAIYFLERIGALTRGPDVTLQGSLTILGTWEETLWLAPASFRPLLESVRAALPELTWTAEQIVLPDLAAVIGCSPTALEQALITWSVAGGCLYRPWERGFRISRRVDVLSGLPEIGADVIAAQEGKLAQMRAYVHSNTCRWQTIRAYFGDARGEPCGCCDRCEPHQQYPWSSRTGRDVPDVSDFLDLATTILALVDWNDQRRDDGRSPFSTLSLIRILRGDEFALMRHSEPGIAADRRRAELRACPYWGVCRTLRRSVAELEGLLQRLLNEGFVGAVTEHIDDTIRYGTVTVTSRGREQLLSGERLGW